MVSARTAELCEVAVRNFNAPGVFEASQGSGEARILGGVSVTNMTGSPADPLSPNASLGLGGFPPQGTATRSAGVEFVLADAFSRLQLSFELRVSPTACSRLAVLVGQGAGDFVEAGTREVTQDGVFVPMSLDLSGVLDPLSSGSTRIRIVTDTRSDGLYPTVKPRPDGTSPYGPLGVLRLDQVVFRGVVQETVQGVPPDLGFNPRRGPEPGLLPSTSGPVHPMELLIPGRPLVDGQNALGPPLYHADRLPDAVLSYHFAMTSVATLSKSWNTRSSVNFVSTVRRPAIDQAFCFSALPRIAVICAR